MKALIKTKSNYKNLNGKYLLVKKIVLDIITCEYQDESGDILTLHFNLREIVQFQN